MSESVMMLALKKLFNQGKFRSFMKWAQNTFNLYYIHIGALVKYVMLLEEN